MRQAARVRARHPDLAPHVSVSLHCEVADILNAYTRLVRQDPTLQGLRAYSAARPPHSEGLGVTIAAYLAAEAECARVNLLHLSSRKALEAARLMRHAFPRVDFGCEVTVGHLLLDYDVPTGALAKVNPPIRSRDDVEFLWQAVLDRQVDWIVSDHACCATETKVAARAAGRRVARQGGVRRHGVAALRRLQRGVAPRALVRPHGRAYRVEPGAALRAARRRVTSLPGSTPTWRSSTPCGGSSSAPPTRRRPRATRRSRGRSSAARCRRRSCEASSSTIAAASSARPAAATSHARRLRRPSDRSAEGAPRSSKGSRRPIHAVVRSAP